MPPASLTYKNQMFFHCVIWQIMTRCSLRKDQLWRSTVINAMVKKLVCVILLWLITLSQSNISSFPELWQNKKQINSCILHCTQQSLCYIVTRYFWNRFTWSVCWASLKSHSLKNQPSLSRCQQQHRMGNIVRSSKKETCKLKTSDTRVSHNFMCQAQ